MKSPVAGKAGSIRLMHLTPSLLVLAEKHGKRLDERSQLRKINDQPPLTTTGLDLVNLFEEHIKGAMLHGGEKRAIHINIQFPADLVDGEDGEYMLGHARGFVEAIFGDEAIFADRLDRDEEGRRNVDVFVAPKYIKQNKSGPKVAISTSRDLKELARAYYPTLDVDEDGKKKEDTRPTIIGSALQDALLDYFKHVMELPGVERGSFKLVSGSDWKQAEQLRLDELDRQKAIYAERQDLVEQDRQALQAERQETAAREARLKKSEAETSRARHLAEAERAQANDVLRKAQEDAARVREETREAAEADRQAAAALRMQAEEQRRLEQDQLALLGRAADDDAGLQLRLSGTTFAMNKEKMTKEEKEAYESPWTRALNAIARSLATMLERIRERGGRLIVREQYAEQRIEQAERREQDAESRAQAALQDEQDALAIATKALLKGQAAHQADVADLSRRRAAVMALRQEDLNWANVVDVLTRSPEKFHLSSDGQITLTEDGAKTVPSELGQMLRKYPPDWVRSIAKRQFELGSALADAREREGVAQGTIQQLSEIIARAGSILTPEQQSVKNHAARALRQSGVGGHDLGL